MTSRVILSTALLCRFTDGLLQRERAAEVVNTVNLLDLALTVVVMATVSLVSARACAGAASQVPATVVPT